MRLLGKEPLDAFAGEHPDARRPLEAWAHAIKRGNFRHLMDLKQAFPAADYVRPFVVFDIGGNKYRLIARVDFELAVVKVSAVLTHAGYDRNDWRR
jgi:mRNA interferase HigB